jgi:hypothetical protein
MAWAAIGLGLAWLAWLAWRWFENWEPIRGRGWGGKSSPEELANDNSYLPDEILYMPLGEAGFEKLLRGQKVYMNEEHKGR